MNVKWFKNPNNVVFTSIEDFVLIFEQELKISGLAHEIKEFMKEPKSEGRVITGGNRTSFKLFYPNLIFKERMKSDDNIWAYFGENQPCYCLQKTEAWREKAYHFFSHKECEFYPCHENGNADRFNCLFCFCPLYCLGRNCGGNYTYFGNIKDCSKCLLPHAEDSYGYIMNKYSEIVDAMADLDNKTV